ncbi:sulfatase-like hydrolase/transferase [candidate division KSB1 bacterium]|nr:sulfatase-like hydrolase/transferase [candidate division KSB1 bacterium]
MKKVRAVHPFFFAIYPVLFLYSYNVYQVSFNSIILPFSVLLLGTAVLFLLSSFIIRSANKAAILVSLFILMFMTYGRIFDKVWWWQLGSIHIGKPRYLFLVGGLLFIIITILVLRNRKDLAKFTKFLNMVSVLLVAFSVINITIYKLKNLEKVNIDEVTDVNLQNPPNIKDIKNLPNIFYIILDGYGGADVLKEIYQYDNSEFLDALTQKGFYVAENSHSNYCQTSLSLTSSLNLKYLNDITDKLGVDNFSREPLREVIRYNQLFKFLKEHGYKITAFSSGYSFTELQNADNYMFDRFVTDEFLVELLNTTPIPHILNEIKSVNEFSWHRDRIFYTLDNIYKIPREDEPYFVFAHIISPHPPFIFKASGKERKQNRQFSFKDGTHFLKFKNASQREYVNNYIQQLQFINTRIKVTIDSLLRLTPDNPPVIVLQADHGPGSHLDWKSMEKTNLKERFSILNAYYLPANGDSLLYKSITPVNTFRVILNRYFDTNLELLRDESYYSTWTRPYDYKKVSPRALR